MKPFLVIVLCCFASFKVFAAGGHRESDVTELSQRLLMINALTGFNELVKTRVFGLDGIPEQVERHLIQQVAHIDAGKRTALGPRTPLHLLTPPNSLAVTRMFEVLGELAEVVRVDMRAVVENAYIFSQFEISLLGLVSEQSSRSGRPAPLIIVIENVDAVEYLERASDRAFIKGYINDLRNRGEFTTSADRRVNLTEFPLLITTSSYPRALWEANAERMSKIGSEHIVDARDLIKPDTQFYDRTDPFFKGVSRSLDLMEGEWIWDLPRDLLIPEVVRDFRGKLLNVPFPFGTYGNSMSFPVIYSFGRGVAVAQDSLIELERTRPVFSGGSLYRLVPQRATGHASEESANKVGAMYTQEIYEAAQEVIRNIDAKVISELERAGISFRSRSTIVYEISGDSGVIEVFGRVVPRNESELEEKILSREAFENWKFFKLELIYDKKTGEVTTRSFDSFTASQSVNAYYRTNTRRRELYVGGLGFDSLYHNSIADRILVSGFEAALTDLVSEKGLTSRVFNGTAGDYNYLKSFLVDAIRSSSPEIWDGGVNPSGEREISRIFEFGYKIGKQLVGLAERVNFAPGVQREIFDITFVGKGRLELQVLGLNSQDLLPLKKGEVRNVTQEIADGRIASRTIGMTWNPSTHQFVYNLPALVGAKFAGASCSRFL